MSNQKVFTPEEAGKRWNVLRDVLWRERYWKSQLQEEIPVSQMSNVLLHFRHGPEFDVLLSQYQQEVIQRAEEQRLKDFTTMDRRTLEFIYAVYRYMQRHMVVNPVYFRNVLQETRGDSHAH
jgi:hypothetical protein